MGQITSGIGLVSGIDTGSIINELISLDQQPVTQLQARVASETAQQSAYNGLSTQLQSLQQIGKSLELPTTFANTSATSTTQGVLTATAGVGAAVGSYQFNVAQLVSSQQLISTGYSSPNALVGAGTISISMGGGNASSQTTLAQLNGGAGVSRGQFRITDGSGHSDVIDLSSAITLDDVVKKINTALDISVKASIQGNHLVLQDESGQSVTHFSVADLGSGQSAQQLGIVGNTTSSTITGTSINTISGTTALAQLNDGRGVGTAAGASDFQINLSNGSNVQVTLGAAQTVGDVLSAINKAGAGKVTAAINTTNNSIDLTDLTGGAGTLSVAALNGSTAASNLGLTGAASGNVVHGGTLLAGLDSVLISSLNGGSGIAMGQISLTNRNGQSATVDLSGAKSFQDIIDSINNAGIGVSASLNNSGDGIALQDTTGGSGNLVVSDVNSTTAATLGIAGSFDTTKPIVNGTNQHVQYVSGDSLLTTYNGGKGVNLGTFRITNSQGTQTTVNLGQGTFNTIGDVIHAINAKGIGVTASINSTGDGLLLTDTAGGSSKLTVKDVSGSAAADLNISGTATGTTINGSFTKTIAVTSTDTLTTLQGKIQTLGFGVAANIVNDGSGLNGYHLSLTALNTGRAGRVVVDGGTTNLTTQSLVDAQDAAVFIGGAGSAQPLLVTSSSNQLTGVIPGVTVQLQGPGSTTLNVARDPSNLTTQLQNFTDGFNAVVDKINTLTKWDSTTNTAGLLLGDPTVQDVQQQMYTVFNSVVQNAGQYKVLADVGLTLTDGAKVQFDSTKFAAAYAADPTAVQNLFTQATTGLGSVIDKSLNEAVDPVSGSITLQDQTITNQIQQFNDSITQLNSLLADKKAQLQEQFNNMETVLAGLQSQQLALSSLGTLSSAAPKSTTSSGTSSTGTSSGTGTSSSSTGTSTG